MEGCAQYTVNYCNYCYNFNFSQRVISKDSMHLFTGYEDNKLAIVRIASK